MDRILNSIALSVCCMASPLGAEDLIYEDLCEASAAVSLPDGRFAVASDDRDELQVYRPVIPVGTQTEDLGKISDLEAAARIGDTVFWITSHSLTKSGKDRPNRQKLLATVIGPQGLPIKTGKKKGDLRGELAALLAHTLADENIDDPMTSKLNIEGLAATPGGSLLIGLRAPLNANGRAIVVRMPRPFEMLSLPQPAAEDLPAKVFTLDLGGLGIRSLEAVPEGGYLVMAGASGENGEKPVLYRWDGEADATPIDGVNLTDLNPEAMIVWQPGWVQILSDNGESACSDDKDDPDTRRWFPSRMVKYSD